MSSTGPIEPVTTDSATGSDAFVVFSNFGYLTLVGLLIYKRLWWKYPAQFLAIIICILASMYYHVCAHTNWAWCADSYGTCGSAVSSARDQYFAFNSLVVSTIFVREWLFKYWDRFSTDTSKEQAYATHFIVSGIATWLLTTHFSESASAIPLIFIVCLYGIPFFFAMALELEITNICGIDAGKLHHPHYGKFGRGSPKMQGWWCRLFSVIVGALFAGVGVLCYTIALGSTKGTYQYNTTHGLWHLFFPIGVCVILAQYNGEDERRSDRKGYNELQTLISDTQPGMPVSQQPGLPVKPQPPPVPPRPPTMTTPIDEEFAEELEQLRRKQ